MNNLIPRLYPPSMPNLIPKSRIVRSVLLLVLTILWVASTLFMGIVLAYRKPEQVIPIYKRLYPVAISVRGALLFAGSNAAPSGDTNAMNTNSLEVTASGSNAGGTVLLALRSSNPAYQSRVIELNRTGEIIWEHRFTGDLRHILLTDVRKTVGGDVVMLGCLSSQVGFCKPSDPDWLTIVGHSGAILRQYQLEATHHAEILPNGNLLTVDGHKEIVRKTSQDGRVVWEWRARDHITPYSAVNFAGYTENDRQALSIRNSYAVFREVTSFGGTALIESTGIDWLHTNSAQRLDNGNTVISLRNIDLVVEVDPSGGIVWSFGALLLKHQHCAWALPNGHLLVTDNGNARVAEFDRATQVVVWQYSTDLLFPSQGCAYRLPNANTLITDAGHLRVLEVTPNGDVVWRVKVTTPGTLALYRAWWSPE